MLNRKLRSSIHSGGCHDCNIAFIYLRTGLLIGRQFTFFAMLNRPGWDSTWSVTLSSLWSIGTVSVPSRYRQIAQIMISGPNNLGAVPVPKDFSSSLFLIDKYFGFGYKATVGTHRDTDAITLPYLVWSNKQSPDPPFKIFVSAFCTNSACFQIFFDVTAILLSVLLSVLAVFLFGVVSIIFLCSCVVSARGVPQDSVVPWSFVCSGFTSLIIIPRSKSSAQWFWKLLTSS